MKNGLTIVLFLILALGLFLNTKNSENQVLKKNKLTSEVQTSDDNNDEAISERDTGITNANSNTDDIRKLNDPNGYPNNSQLNHRYDNEISHKSEEVSSTDSNKTSVKDRFLAFVVEKGLPTSVGICFIDIILKNETDSYIKAQNICTAEFNLSPEEVEVLKESFSQSIRSQAKIIDLDLWKECAFSKIPKDTTTCWKDNFKLNIQYIYENAENTQISETMWQKISSSSPYIDRFLKTCPGEDLRLVDFQAQSCLNYESTNF